MKAPRNFFRLLFTATCILTILSCTDEKCTNLLNEGTYIFGYAFLDSTDTNTDILVRLIQTGDSTYTDANGHYEFPRQQPDTYTVVAGHEGYISSFVVIHASGIICYRAPNLILHPLTCFPRDSIPDGYPLGIRFCTDISFFESAYSSIIGDSLFVAAWELDSPPYRSAGDYLYADDTDIIIVSSLGDREIVPMDRYLDSVPEIWRMGYIIDSTASETPGINNGVVEIEPTGGWAIAMYQSYWLKRYVCKSIKMLPES